MEHGIVLGRREGERVRLLPKGWAEDDALWVTLVEVRSGKQARLGFDVTDDVQVLREELVTRGA